LHRKIPLTSRRVCGLRKFDLELRDGKGGEGRGREHRSYRCRCYLPVTMGRGVLALPKQCVRLKYIYMYIQIFIYVNILVLSLIRGYKRYRDGLLSVYDVVHVGRYLGR
jgi:hypothetical protein